MNDYFVPRAKDMEKPVYLSKSTNLTVFGSAVVNCMNIEEEVNTSLSTQNAGSPFLDSREGAQIAENASYQQGGEIGARTEEKKRRV